MALPAQRWTLAFTDPAREAAYMDAFGSDVRGFYRVAVFAILLLWSSAVGLDVVAAPDDRRVFLVIRFALVAPVIVAALIVGFLDIRIFVRWWQPVGLVTYATVLGGVIGLVAVASSRSVVAYSFGGFLLTLLTGAGVGLTRALPIVAVAAVMSIAMGIALATSPHVPGDDLAVDSLWMFVAVAAAAVITVQAEVARRTRFVQAAELERERRRTEELLLNLLPEPIAMRLKDGPRTIADGLDEVTVLFADLKGFAGLATEVPPEQLVERLDRVFTAFDELARTHGLEKIKTMGDAYMAVSGAPVACGDHADRAATMAVAMIARLGELEPTLTMRIGLASGPVVAGVIGRSKMSYDLWGETVNLASRMESHGVPGRVQIAAHTRELLGGTFRYEDRGPLELKGLGPTAAYLLTIG